MRSNGTRKAPPHPVVPAEFQPGKIDAMSPAALAELLKSPKSTTFEKAKACQRLAHIGTIDAVPALASLLPDPRMSHYARYGLETNPNPAADDALRAALPKVKGALLIGVLNSVSKRRDAGAVPLVAKLMYDADPEVGRAAASALGHISGSEASKAIQEALGKTSGPVRAAAGDAALICAEGLIARGSRDEALLIYNKLLATDIPQPVRLAAMHGIISAETSLSRPR
jgi:HEAT repeat protein